MKRLALALCASAMVIAALPSAASAVWTPGDGCQMKPTFYGSWGLEAGGAGQFPCADIVVAGDRVGVRTVDGGCYAKEGSGAWRLQWAPDPNAGVPGCAQIVVTTNRVGVRTTTGKCVGKEGTGDGGLTSGWSTLWEKSSTVPACARLALSGSRVGVLTVAGTCEAKDGGLGAPWRTQVAPGCAQIEVTDGRVAVRNTVGACHGKEGTGDSGLTSPPWNLIWEQSAGVPACTNVAIAGSRIGVRTENGKCVAKDGTFGATWRLQTEESGGNPACVQIVVTPNRVGVRTSNGSCHAKEGTGDAGLYTPSWSLMWATDRNSNPAVPTCAQLALTESRVAVVAATFSDSFESSSNPWGEWATPRPVYDDFPGTVTALAPLGTAATDGARVLEAALTSSQVRAELQCHIEECAGGQGTEWWYEWDFRIPPSGTLPAGNGANVMQAKEDVDDRLSCYSGGVEMHRVSTERFRLDLSTRAGAISDPDGGCDVSVDNLRTLGEFARGEWHHILLHFKWSTGTNGVTEAWVDGVKVPGAVNERNLIDGTDAMMFRLGLYAGSDHTSWQGQYDNVRGYRPQ